MKTRSRRLVLEALESRDAPSSLGYGDFNNDGLTDMAAITAPTTVTVSLANPDGSYTVSAVLSGPKNQTIIDVGVSDLDGDGNLDVYAFSQANSGGYTTTWAGNGDGTFDPGTTDKYRWPFGHVGHGGTW